MSEVCSYLFVYGTLRRGTGHPMATMLADHADYICAAKTRGRLYDLGSFPGMVEAEDADDWVHGDLFQMHSPDVTLLELDRYEECGSDDPQPWFFRRTHIKVVTEDNAEVQAWGYLYCRAVCEEKRIGSGVYVCGDLTSFDWRDHR